MAARTAQKVIVEKSGKFYVAMVIPFDDEMEANKALQTKQDEINVAKTQYDAILVKKDSKHYLVTIHSEHTTKASAEAAK